MLTVNSFMDTGIYAIEHKSTGRMYIGSASSFAKRWRVHLCLLRKGRHHSPHLQSAWTKHGESSFDFKKLLVCAQSYLILYEQILIDGFSTVDRAKGFNARAKAESNLGKKASAETKQKIRDARAKQVFSEETRALWSRNRTGRKMPEWFGEFTRLHRTGFKHSEETKAFISSCQIGRPVSLNTREMKSKITHAQVTEIKNRFAQGSTQQTLANEFSLSQSAISLIVRGKRWTNLPATPQEKLK